VPMSPPEAFLSSSTQEVEVNSLASRRDESKPERPPATTLEGREKQLVSAAVDLAEQRIRDGTASSQVLAFYLKLGTTREQLEQQKLRSENALLEARVKELESAANVEELYAEAIKAMRSYSGVTEADESYEADLHGA
jgi:hypothetical protein